ncbi:MAG: hypothetical protein SGI83_16295 [Bacteroidota bacterium]|nr:hypothetical protein [Bacteroidota bacterium]
MRKSTACALIAIFFSISIAAQNNTSTKLKVFIDCSNAGCDMTFIRSEINLVDFLLDRIAADVHVLVTEQGTGSGGSKYQLIFFGQNRFKNFQDTLHFNTDPNATDFEERDMLVKYIKLGLAPCVAKTEAAKDAVISMKRVETEANKKDSLSQPTKDSWNYWVFRVGANGNFNADANYKDRRLGANFSANRTTEELKVSFGFYASTNKSVFEFEDAGVRQKIINNNHNIDFSHSLIKSINDHWSYGYETNYSQNTFSNNKGRVYVRAAVEYDIFPYKEVNNRFFTISYGLTARNNHYYDTTIYNKVRETLFGHRADANLSLNQKWGTTSFGINYQNYFHDWKLFNLGIFTSTDVRITGGLSFRIYFSGELTRDQVYLPKGGATEQEILTRRRQIASGYNYYTSFGLNYRFGSKLNNFVNPRFEGSNNN